MKAPGMDPARAFDQNSSYWLARLSHIATRSSFQQTWDALWIPEGVPRLGFIIHAAAIAI